MFPAQVLLQTTETLEEYSFLTALTTMDSNASQIEMSKVKLIKYLENRKSLGDKAR